MAKKHKKFSHIHIKPMAGTHYSVHHEPAHEPNDVMAPMGDDEKHEKLFAHGERADLHKHLDKLMDDAKRGANATMTVDLESQEIRGPDGGVVRFEIDPFRKHCLLNGLDDIGLTLQKADGIAAFEARTQAERPWT